MNTNIIKRKVFLLVVILLFGAIIGIFSVNNVAYAISYQETDFAITDYQSFEELLTLNGENFSGKTVRLFVDIDLEQLPDDVVDDVYFSTFNGTFEGNGHIVYGCKKNLFGTIGASGRVRNLVLDRCELTSDCALVKVNNGIVSDVSLYGWHRPDNANNANGVVFENNNRVERITSCLDIYTAKPSACLLCGKTNADLTESVFLGTVTSTSVASPYTITYPGEPVNDQKTKKTTFNYFSVYPFSYASGGTVTDCSAVFSIAAQSLPYIVYPCTQASCASSSVIFTATTGLETQPTLAYTTGLYQSTTEETVSIDDESDFTGTLYSYVRQPVDCFDDSYIVAFSDTGSGYDTVKKVWDDSSVLREDDLTALSSNYYFTTGFYPVRKTIATGEGTQQNPALLSSANDFYRLRLFVTENGSALYGQMIDNVDFSLEEEVRLLMNADFYLDGDNCLLYNLPSSGVLFDETFFNVTQMGRITDVYMQAPQQTTSYSDVNMETMASETVVDGSGTANDPYVIDNAAQLRGFILGENNVQGKYAVLNGDIIINSASAHGFLLGLENETLNATINGCGHSVYGLCGEPFIGEVGSTGTIVNTDFFTASLSDAQQTQAALCVTNSGTLSGICLVGEGDYECGFTYTNDGVITLCQNALYASYAFSAENSGSIEYCINNAYNLSTPAFCDYFAGTDDEENNCLQCVSLVAGGYALLNGATLGREAYAVFTKADYIVLTENGYDEDVFGYEVGTQSSVMPVLRKYGVEYKTAAEKEITHQPNVTYGDCYITSDFIYIDSDERCSATITSSVADNMLTVESCDCNGPAVLSDNPTGYNLRLHSSAEMPSLTVALFDQLATSYDQLMANYPLTSSLDEFTFTSAAADYSSFDSSVRGLFAASYLATSIGSNGAIVGINNSFLISTGENDPDYADLQSAIAALFGYDDAADFIANVDILASEYAPTPTDRLRYDGTVYTNSGIFVMPFIFVNNQMNARVSACLFIDGSRMTSLWVSDLNDIFTAVNYQNAAGLDPIEDEECVLTVYGRCYLFESKEIIDVSWNCQYNSEVVAVPTADMDDPNVVKEVGTYVLTVMIAETEKTLPYKATTSFNILQAEAPGISRSVNFSNLSFEYTGESVPEGNVTFDAEDATIASLCNDYGYTFSYSYTLYNSNDGSYDTIGRTDIVEVGNAYRQSYEATSRNYLPFEPVAPRVITITKKTIAVTVSGQTEVEYGTALNYSAFTASAPFVGKDSTTTLETMLAESYSTRWMTDYVTTDNAGTVRSVWFNVSGITLKNYILTMSPDPVERGSVTVIKTSVAQGDIWFYDAVRNVPGSYSFDYDGTEHTISAMGIPSGVTVEYSPSNIVKNAGTHRITLTVIVDADNYDNLDLIVDVTVNKAPLTIKASDVTKFYGYSVSYDDFTDYTTTGLCGNDTIADVLQNVQLQLRPESAPGVYFPEDAVPGFGDYVIKVIDAGENNFETDNYIIAVESGTFSIIQIPLTELYRNNVGGDNTDFDNRSREYDGSFTDLSDFVITFFDSSQVDTITYVYKLGGVIVDPVVKNAGTYTIEGTVTPSLEMNDYSPTVYTMTYTILPYQTNLTFVAATGYEGNFSNGTYTYTYVPGGNVNFATAAYCPCVADGFDVENADYAGTLAFFAREYTVVVTYLSSDPNYSGCSATATLIINKYDLSVEVEGEYNYSNTNLTPTLTLPAEVQTELNAHSFGYLYTDSFNNEETAVSNAGNYTLILSCLNDNYNLQTTEFDITIKSLRVNFAIPSFSFDYGTTGLYQYTDTMNVQHTFYIGENYVEYRNYLISRTVYTSLVSDVVLPIVRFRLSADTYLQYFPANVSEYENYTAQSIQQLNGNFQLEFAQSVKVHVNKRTLVVSWEVFDEGVWKECGENENYFVTTYSGTTRAVVPYDRRSSIVSALSYNVTGLVGSDVVSEIGIQVSIQKENRNATINSVGEYTCKLSLLPLSNYVIDTASDTFVITITKRSITIYVDDVSIEQYERFTGTTISTDPGALVGEDEGKLLRELSGYSLSFLCNYNADNAVVGAKYAIDISIGFENYAPNVRIPQGQSSAAILTVVNNTYPKYTLVGRTFEYDGTPKSLTIPVDDAIRVTYVENGSQTNVGKYRVVVRLTYPTGREDTLSADMTIEKATPRVEKETSYVIFRSGGVLSDDIIHAQAYIGTDTPIEGNFYFIDNNQMREGARTYKIGFDPVDTTNINSLSNIDLVVKCYDISGGLLSFKGEYSYSGEDTMKIKDRVVIDLNRDYLEEISDRVELYQNGNYVQNFILNKEGEELLEIRFDENTVFSLELYVVLDNGDDKKEELVVNEEFFKLTDFQLDLESSVIYVPEGGGIIALSDQFSDDYRLFVNGMEIGYSGISVSPDAGTVVLEIKHKKIGTTYRKEFTVKSSTVLEEEKKSFGGLSKTVYIILIVVGVVVVGGILLLLLKRH